MVARQYSFRLSLAILLAASWAVAGEDRLVSKQELERRLSYYARLTELKADFTQIKRIREMAVELKSQGFFRLKRPERVEWVVTKPSFVFVELTKERMLIKTGEGASAVARVIKFGELATDEALRSVHDLTAWLELDATVLDGRYWVHEKSGRPGVLKFNPRDQTGSSFSSIEMTLAKQGHVSRLVIEERSGDGLDISFSKPKVK